MASTNTEFDPGGEFASKAEVAEAFAINAVTSRRITDGQSKPAGFNDVAIKLSEYSVYICRDGGIEFEFDGKRYFRSTATESEVIADIAKRAGLRKSEVFVRLNGI